MSNYEDARRWLGPGRGGKYDPAHLPGRIWIIEGLVGPKNPNLDFTNVSAPGFAICQLRAGGDISIHSTESSRNHDAFTR